MYGVGPCVVSCRLQHQDPPDEVGMRENLTRTHCPGYRVRSYDYGSISPAIGSSLLRLVLQSILSRSHRGSTMMVLNDDSRTSPGFERGGFDTNFF